MATKPLKAYSARGPYDDLHTPREPIDLLVPYLHQLDYDYNWPILWESAPPKRGNSKLAERLEHHGFDVEQWPGRDFFGFGRQFVYGHPGRFVQVTNPPYSIKAQWILHSWDLGNPFALLLPITTLGINKKHPGLQELFPLAKVVLLPGRVDFTGGKQPWFSVAWFLWRWPTGPGIEIAENAGA